MNNNNPIQDNSTSSSSSSSSNTLRLSLQQSKYFQISSHALKNLNLPPLEPLLTAPGTSPYIAWSNALVCGLAAWRSWDPRRGYIATYPLVGLALIFAGTGYITLLDTTNGPSASAAWGTMYIYSSAMRTFKAKRVGPTAVLAYITATTALHLSEMLELTE
ncbi:hypothetical protein BASA61_007029 [Batrachochytrium salamandrivorans]|nr:hypothetical protein BASA62_001475 [Batrachochytrium salamandrivorans]KAH6585164.1 hypothetical protein BASA61_007029 [Batrachochytrium salamandrivorans]KAH9250483.1 hypothetical protein BASA81_011723 [Batrachochytrium salamandrivorans]KAH9270648.1 hypothetical protein BASA83_007256 [Batrachochytrium salamandrivorans]